MNNFLIFFFLSFFFFFFQILDRRFQVLEALDDLVVHTL